MSQTNVVLTSGRVCELTGVDQKTLHYWTRMGVVRPSVTESAGTGHPRAWSIDDAAYVLCVKRLTDGGISLAIARELIAAASPVGSAAATAVVEPAKGRGLVQVMLKAGQAKEEIIQAMQGAGSTV